MKQVTKNVLALLVGIALGAFFVSQLRDEANNARVQDIAASEEPLYWVAPMDANYRRDKPGKSPMGMDLLPVYAQGTRVGEGPGAVEISPQVVNNLGVRTAPVVLGPLQTRISTVGYVQYDEDRLVHLHHRVTGGFDIELLYPSLHPGM